MSEQAKAEEGALLTVLLKLEVVPTEQDDDFKSWFRFFVFLNQI